MLLQRITETPQIAVIPYHLTPEARFTWPDWEHAGAFESILKKIIAAPYSHVAASV